MMKVKKIAELDESTMPGGLSDELIDLLKDYSSREIVDLARRGQLTKIPRIGAGRAAQITEALKKAGYVSTESAESFGVRRLLADIGVIRDFGTNAEYESREEFTPKQLEKIMTVIDDALEPREIEILTMRYGLDGSTVVVPRAACGKQFNISGERARQIETQALYRLRSPIRRVWLAEFCYGHAVNKEQIIGAEISTMLVRDMGLRARAANALRRYGVATVGQLCEYSAKDLESVPAIAGSSINEIRARLHELGVGLRGED